MIKEEIKRNTRLKPTQVLLIGNLSNIAPINIIKIIPINNVLVGFNLVFSLISFVSI